jgi:hypothetical protein
VNRLLGCALLLPVVLACLACSYEQPPPRGPESSCVDACHARVPRCSDTECARGCNLVIDRLEQHEGDTVIACVAASTTCVDRRWAACAARVGPHADGGPPPPPPPKDFEDEE